MKRQGIVNAWSDPAFRAAIERTGRKQIAMGGVTTDVCLRLPRDRRGARRLSGAGGARHLWLTIRDFGRDIPQAHGRRGIDFTCTNTLISEWTQDWPHAGRSAVDQLTFMEILPPITPVMEPPDNSIWRER